MAVVVLLMLLIFTGAFDCFFNDGGWLTHPLLPMGVVDVFYSQDFITYFFFNALYDYLYLLVGHPIVGCK